MIVTKQSADACSRLFLAGVFFYSEDGGDKFLRNVGSHKIYTELHPRRRHSSLPQWKPQILHTSSELRLIQYSVRVGHFSQQGIDDDEYSNY
jgi:hypothetical protein